MLPNELVRRPFHLITEDLIPDEGKEEHRECFFEEISAFLFVFPPFEDLLCGL
jgi:hypothetical protein